MICELGDFPRSRQSGYRKVMNDNLDRRDFFARFPSKYLGGQQSRSGRGSEGASADQKVQIVSAICER
jgi:hypothetical protein